MKKTLRINVGIDFGTTYSGLAWTLDGSVEDIEVVSSWPGGGNRTMDKVPSTLLYGEGTTQWGYQIGPLRNAIRGVKLLLDDSLQVHYAPAIKSRDILRKYNKGAVDVTGEYLKYLVEYLKILLERRFGLKAEELDLDFVLTVPAVWSDKAKDATLRASMKAGIESSRIFLISEPEAAAIYSLQAVYLDKASKDDVFVICDAGGGTVDLISYIVKEIEPLRLEEVTEGTGAVCGSLLLDDRFEQLLRAKMGAEYESLDIKSREMAVSYWRDMVKPNFRGQYDSDYSDVEYFIPVPGAPNNHKIGMDNGFIEIESDEVEGIFNPIVEEVENLVYSQIKSVLALDLNVKAIVLVGGFGSSEYLCRRLKKANPSITVLQPPNAWSAIVRGAVHRGSDTNRVEARVSRRWYGVTAKRRFDPSLDVVAERYWCSLEEEWFVGEHMTWYIKKHSKISEYQPIRFDFYRAIKTSRCDDLIFEDQLFFCNDESAPGVKDRGVIPLCTVESNLSKVPRELFLKNKNSKGVEYYKVPYTLAVTPTSASLIFELEFNGVSYGTVRSRY